MSKKRFIYHGYLQIAELDVANAMETAMPVLRKTYLWDPLEPVATRILAMSLFDETGTWAEDLYCTHDLLKNATALFGIRAGRRALYEYGPYGNILRMEGNAVEDNPFRFSSEYADDELGLVYYNYRYYNPRDGRWISRDLIGEIDNEIMKNYLDYEKFNYRNKLKNYLDYHIAMLIIRWNIFYEDGINLDNSYSYHKDKDFFQEMVSYLKSYDYKELNYFNRYAFVSNSLGNFIDLLGEQQWEQGPSGDYYRPDPIGHGKHPDGTPIDPHVDRKPKNGGTKYRYDLDGTPRKNAPKIPKKDVPLFKKIAKKCLKFGISFGKKKIPVIGWGLAIEGAIEGYNDEGWWGAIKGALW